MGRRTIVVALTVAVILGVLWFAGQISNVLFMAFIALFVAVALEPPVHYLAKRGWRRGTATGLVFLVVFLMAIGFLVALAPLLIEQVEDFIDLVPGWVDSTVTWLNNTFGIDLSSDIASGLEEEASFLASWLAQHAGGIVGGIIGVGAAVGSFLIFASTVAIFAFYMVAELPQLQQTVLSAMPERQQRRALHIWDVAVEKMGGYIYSRLVLAFVSATFTTLFLVILDVPFALSLGVFVGVLSQFVPVVGTYIAAILPALVALSSNGLTTALIVTAYFIGYQQLENLVFSPRITKRTMSIHPAISIAAIIIGGNLMGAIGVVLALPMTGIIQALISETRRRHEVVVDSPTDPVDIDEPVGEGGEDG